MAGRAVKRMASKIGAVIWIAGQEDHALKGSCEQPLKSEHICSIVVTNIRIFSDNNLVRCARSIEIAYQELVLEYSTNTLQETYLWPISASKMCPR